MDKLYTIQEVATKLNLSDKTLRRWEDAGRFTPSRTLGNQRRYSLDDLQILDALKHGTFYAQKDLLSVEQAAKLCGVSPITIVRWENRGLIHPFITSGNTYYPRERLLEKMAELKTTYPEPIPTPSEPEATWGDSSTGGPSEARVGTPKAGGVSPSDPQSPTPAPRLTPLSPSLTQNRPSFDLRSSLFNVLITLILLLSYHLLLNSKSSSPNSPTDPSTPSGVVQGATTVDPRLDLLEQKFLDHLSSEMLKDATPRNTSTLNLDGTALISGTETILKGTDEYTFAHDGLTQDSVITVTFLSDYAPAKKYWITPRDGSFTLHTDFPLGNDSRFNYSFIIPKN